MTNQTPDPRPILVLGANGKTGRRVSQSLENKHFKIRKGSRTGTPAFDWNDHSTFAPILKGVRAAYIVYTPDLSVPEAPDAIRAFIHAAKQEGLQHLVLLSGRGEPEARTCELLVEQSGIDWTIVRASWFNQNFDEGDFLDLVMSGTVALPAGDTPEPFIDADDIADVVVASLTEPGHAGKLYEVTGPRSLTFTQAIQEIALSTGREINYIPIQHHEFTEGLAQTGMPQYYIDLLSYLFKTILDGRNAQPAQGVQQALGRPPRDFSDYAQSIAKTGVWNTDACPA